VAEKQYTDMTDDELRAALSEWEDRILKAAGWSSAYFAATQVEEIVRLGQARGLPFVNRFPIEKGQAQ
jgi:hypothetical protein